MLQTFVQSFSQGQITIPKKFRDELNLDNIFWLKLFIDNQNRIIAEPVDREKDTSDYLDTLLSISGNWFDIKDYKRMRKDLSNRLENIYADTN